MSLLGVVLAGGDSRRFGSPKALARLHGRPLWRLAADRLRSVCPRVTVVANDARVAREVSAGEGGLEVRPDLKKGLGPLGGVATALALASESGLDGALVLAVDMPWVEKTALRGLAKAWRRGRKPCVPRTGPPWGFDPLCAVYPVDALPSLEAALAGGLREVGAFARRSGPTVVDTGLPVVTFRSVNEPRELPPPGVSIVGNKKSGKTTLAVALIRELAGRGRRVMSVKHGHHFRLDTPGTDSWRQRREGLAERVLLAGPDEFAVMGEWGLEGEPTLDALLVRHLGEAEIVVVEGYREAPIPKVEIFRSHAQPEPVLDPAKAAQAGALAVVTDCPSLPWSVPVLEPGADDLAARVADIVEEALL